MLRWRAWRSSAGDRGMTLLVRIWMEWFAFDCLRLGAWTDVVIGIAVVGAIAGVEITARVPRTRRFFFLHILRFTSQQVWPQRPVVPTGKSRFIIV